MTRTHATTHIHKQSTPRTHARPDARTPGRTSGRTHARMHARTHARTHSATYSTPRANGEHHYLNVSHVCITPDTLCTHKKHRTERSSYRRHTNPTPEPKRGTMSNFSEEAKPSEIMESRQKQLQMTHRRNARAQNVGRPCRISQKRQRRQET